MVRVNTWFKVRGRFIARVGLRLRLWLGLGLGLGL